MSAVNTRSYRVLIIAALALLLIIAALLYVKGKSNNTPSFSTVKVNRGDIENLVTATGSLQPRNYVDVGAQVSGQLKTLHVSVGDKVKKGDLLAEIDATLYIAKVDATRAQLRNQNALLTDRQAQLELAQSNYQRTKNLVAEDAASVEALEAAKAALQSANAQITALRAQIEQTASGLREEEANLAFARIYAPMDGTVVTIDARQGQTLNASQSAPIILRLADLSVMTVEAQVSEADISKLYVGMPVYFTIFGGEGQRWYSKLSKIEPTPVVNNNVVLYNALFDVPNASGVLMTQMTTQVFFIVSQAKNTLQVPLTALRFKPATTKVADNTAQNTNEQAALQGRMATVQWLNAKLQQQEKDVVVGVSNRVYAQIISGLEEGDSIIINIKNTGQSKDNARMPFAGPRVGR